MNRRQTVVRYVVPMILSSICFFLYTIVDGVFVGNGIGVDAVGAVNVAMPFVMIVNALFMFVTTGGVTIAAIRFGRGDDEGANLAFMHSFSMMIFISLVLTVWGVLFPRAIALMLGANDTYLTMVRDYVFWYSVFLIPSALAVLLQGFCRNDGSPLLVSIAVIVSTVLNVFGDWLTVFPLHLGIKGAAIATGVSQTAGLAVTAIHFFRKKGKLRFGGFVPSGKLYGKIMKRGLPEMISKCAAPMSTAFMNLMLFRMMDDTAVNTFSLLSYIASFSVAFFFGTSEGLQPLYGRCYGAKDEQDLQYYFHVGLVINLVSSVGIYFLLFAVGRPLCVLFNADEPAIAMTMEAMPRYAWSFCAIAVSSVVSTCFYSTKRTKEALVLNFCRSFLFSGFSILLLPRLFGPDIIWYTYGIGETLSAALALVLLGISKRHGASHSLTKETGEPAGRVS